MIPEEWMEKTERNATTHGVNVISMVVATHGANAITMVAFSDLQFSPAATESCECRKFHTFATLVFGYHFVASNSNFSMALSVGTWMMSSWR